MRIHYHSPSRRDSLSKMSSITSVLNAEEPVAHQMQEVKDSISIVSAQAVINRLLYSAIPSMSSETKAAQPTDDDPLTPKDMELIEMVISI